MKINVGRSLFKLNVVVVMFDDV